MSKTLQQVQEELNANLPRSIVKTRDAGHGRTLDYLSNFDVKKSLNDILGIGMWAYEIKDLTCVHNGVIKDRFNKDIYSTSYVAKVRAVFQLGSGCLTEFIDVGFGNGTDKADPGKPHELASKEAVSDALKRCACNLGMRLGLALYDKDQNFVIEEEEKKPVIVNSSGNGVEATTAPLSVISPDKYIKSIVATSKVLVAQGKANVDDLKSLMKNQYGTDNKDDLTAEQASAFLAQLKGKL